MVSIKKESLFEPLCLRGSMRLGQRGKVIWSVEQLRIQHLLQLKCQTMALERKKKRRTRTRRRASGKNLQQYAYERLMPDCSSPHFKHSQALTSTMKVCRLKPARIGIVAGLFCSNDADKPTTLWSSVNLINVRLEIFADHWHCWKWTLMFLGFI